MTGACGRSAQAPQDRSSVSSRSPATLHSFPLTLKIPKQDGSFVFESKSLPLVRPPVGQACLLVSPRFTPKTNSDVRGKTDLTPFALPEAEKMLVDHRMVEPGLWALFYEYGIYTLTHPRFAMLLRQAADGTFPDCS